MSNRCEDEHLKIDEESLKLSEDVFQELSFDFPEEGDDVGEGEDSDEGE